MVYVAGAWSVNKSKCSHVWRKTMLPVTWVCCQGRNPATSFFSFSFLVHAAAFGSLPQYYPHGWRGFALTSSFLYYTGSDKHIPETKSAISQTYRLLFCLTGSKKQQQKAQHSERGMCVRQGRELGVTHCLLVETCVCFRQGRELGVTVY